MIVIKKFSRVGCVPCAALANYFTEIDLAQHGAELVEIDIERKPEAIEQYGLRSVPVLVFERNGIEITRINGLRPVDEIVEAIELAKVLR
jgi:thioredoxin 1